MQVGVPFVPVSPSYSLMSDDFGQLKHVFEITRPGLVYVPEAGPFSPALQAVESSGPILIAGAENGDLIPFGELKKATPGREFDRAYERVTGDTAAQYLFTSGSTGMPKAVILTQRMMCANATGICQLLPVLDEHPPIVVDWLPWHHVAGGNKNFNLILRCGGTLYVDGGRPQPGKFEETIRNLREIQPTFMHNVPLVYGMLVPYLEADDDFARHLFERMDFAFYAAAPMPFPLWERLDRVATRAIGKRVPFLSSLGSTETTPSCVLCHWASAVSGNLGLPLPAVEIKLAPTAGKLEMRVRGPNVTPGYFGNAEATKAAFDDEGFYRMGDAVRFVDEARPEEGLLFDGRIGENFKLQTGTWVQTGTVRTDALTAISPLAQDAAVTGEGRAELGLLLFLNRAECARALALDPDVSFEALAANAQLRGILRQRLDAYNRNNRGSSRRIPRFMIMTEPPSVSGHEITDKGYLNQRAVLDRRAELVEALYAAGPRNDVILL
jgi:feruloyl-CoA synthase